MVFLPYAMLSPEGCFCQFLSCESENLARLSYRSHKSHLSQLPGPPWGQLSHIEWLFSMHAGGLPPHDSLPSKPSTTMWGVCSVAALIPWAKALSFVITSQQMERAFSAVLPDEGKQRRLLCNLQVPTQTHRPAETGLVDLGERY